VREDLDPNDYSDPGPYRNPEGTVAYEIKLATERRVPRSESSSARPRTAQ
jgi:manganese oxidase